MTTGNIEFLTSFLVHRENTFRDNNNKRIVQGPAANTRKKKAKPTNDLEDSNSNSIILGYTIAADVIVIDNSHEQEQTLQLVGPAENSNITTSQAVHPIENSNVTVSKIIQTTKKSVTKVVTTSTINNEIHNGIEMNIAKKNAEFNDGATALMDLRNSTKDGNDNDNNKKPSSNNNDNALQTNNECDKTSENNMINDNDASNESDNTSETNINDDNAATKGRGNLKLSFAEMYGPKVTKINPCFQDGVVSKMGKNVGSKSNMNYDAEEDYGAIGWQKVNSANKKQFLENAKKIGKNARKRGGKMPLSPEDIIDSDVDSDKDDNEFGLRNEDDTDDLIEVYYPPFGHFGQGWNGRLHISLLPKEHNYNTVIAVTRIDKGSFVDRFCELQQGHILMKINDDWVHEYTYERVMSEIDDQMEIIQRYPREYFLTLKFSRDKV